jgi:hypothetical protein
MYNLYVITKKKNVYVCIYPLSRIHNTNLISAYFGLDSRECKCFSDYTSDGQLRHRGEELRPAIANPLAQHGDYGQILQWYALGQVYVQQWIVVG